jgi:hypothetical protein
MIATLAGCDKDSPVRGHTALVRCDGPRAGAWALVSLLVLALVLPARADEFGSAVYVRSDSDHTTVVSPRVRASADVAPDTNVGVVYGVDVWSSASIDIRAAASRVVSEQRDEIDASASHDFGDVSLGAAYRWSKENDYLSNAGSLSLAYDFADNAATLSASVFVAADAVGRSGDPAFDRPLSSTGGRAGLTQVIDPKTLVQLSYDLSYFDGYQASPYRFVPLGGAAGCAGRAPLCVPERVPVTRLRHAPVVRVQRALGATTSVGLSYRFYVDDWGLRSHTIEARFGWLVAHDAQLSLRYRFYAQGAAEFYRARYALPSAEFVTVDRELSPLTIQRAGVDYAHAFDLGDSTLLDAGLALGVNFYRYADFPGLDHVTALEVSASLGLRL